MKDTLRLVGVLTAICLVAGSLLAVVYRVTSDPIAAAARQEKLEALNRVLPPHDNAPDSAAHVASFNGRERTFMVARRAGTYVGAAFETTSDDGYGGTIRLMVGVDATDTIHGVAVLSQTETPGLGAKIETPEFRAQFKGNPADPDAWCAVRKDGPEGRIDAITGATISSRAVAGAVRAGLADYRAERAALRDAGTGGESQP